MNLSVLLVASMLFVTYMTVRILHSYLNKKEEEKSSLKKYTKVERK
ncbi:TPA: hypothetical protein QCY66_005654 [Bacillus cereus]|nr:hypothetical protein [Bacillus cereus]